MDLCPLLSVLWLQVTLAEGLRLTTFTLYTQPRVTWQSAVDFCDSQGHELVRVTSQAEQDFITSMAQAGKPWNNKLTGGDTWSSLYDPDPSTPGAGYHWRLLHPHCQPLDPKTEWSNWYSDEPINGHVDWCVRLQWGNSKLGFMWRTANCNTKIRFICRHHEGQCTTYESYNEAHIKTSSPDFVTTMQENGNTSAKCLKACSEKDFCYAAETMMVFSRRPTDVASNSILCRLYIANGSVTAVDMEKKNGTTLYLPTNCSEVKLNETDFYIPEKPFSPECESVSDSPTTMKTTLTTALTTTTPTTPSPIKRPSPSKTSPSTTTTTTPTTTTSTTTTLTTPPPMTSTPLKRTPTTTPTTVASSTTTLTTPPPTIPATTTTSTTGTTRAEGSTVGHGHVRRSLTVTSTPTTKAQDNADSIPATSSASTSVKEADSASTTTTPSLTATASPSKGQNGSFMLTEEMSTNKKMLCPCSCKASRPGRGLTAEQQEVLSRLMKSLVIDHKNTTVRKRKLTSAADSRQSAQMIGWLGVVVLLLVLRVVVVMDLSAVCCDRHWRAGAKKNQVQVKAVKCD